MNNALVNALAVTLGQASDKGRKPLNQDFYGSCLPKEPLLSSKGVAIALADGISSSQVSQVASEAAVKGFLEDYYCTSESWSVKTSAQSVLLATNSWLYSQTRKSQYRYNKDKGYVCTFSAMIVKSTTAHLFHAGDSRIYRVQGQLLELLTEDHRTWISSEKSYLSRALGVNEHLEIEYQSLSVEVGDTFVLATDGIYEFVEEAFIIEALQTHSNDLDQVAKMILEQAYQNGSDDNLTVQLLRIDQLPVQDEKELYQQLTQLPFPPVFKPRMTFDGYEILREVYFSSRSHVYLALDSQSLQQVILKVPATDHKQNVAYLERFLREEWIARRLNNAHVLKAVEQTRQRHYLYSVTEFIEGKTLAQWMRDHPAPDLETVRKLIEQLAKGLRAFHRQEMLHQDLRPENVMIDQNGIVKIIDFGSARVAGLMEIHSPVQQAYLLGTAQYTAPEYFLGEAGTERSDQFSLGVIAYQLLSGHLPYGTQVAKARTKASQRQLTYRSVLSDEREIPAWIDGVLKKAVHPNPLKRYDEISEFIVDLRHPNQSFLMKTRAPIMERHPVRFWQGVSFMLLMALLWTVSLLAEKS